MSMDTHVNVTLRVNSSGVSRVGFGTIMVPSYRGAALFGAAPSLTFTQLADAEAAGFPADGPEALAIERILEQSPHVKSVKFFPFTNKPTLSYRVDVARTGLLAYEANVKGEGVTATKVSYKGLADIVFVDAAVNVATDAINLPAHGMLTADRIVRFKTTGVLPASAGAALAVDTNIWPIVVDADHIKLATSKANALAGVAIDITGAAGGGNHTLVRSQNDTIVANLVDQINAVPGKNYLAVQVPGAGETDYFTVTGSALANYFTLELLDTSVLTILNTTADPGVAADLAAALVADPDFYYVGTWTPSQAIVTANANWVEATPFKAFVPAVSDSACENTVKGNGDVLDAVSALGLKRTLGPIYHRKPDQMLGFGAAGRVAPLTVGKWTLAYKAIAGATYDKFTATQLANLAAKRGTYYKLEGDGPILWEGMVGNLSYGFFDVTVGLDRFLDDLQKSMYGVFVGQDKVEYTDEDIEHLRAAGFGAFRRGIRDGYVAAGTPGSLTDPEPTLVFPTVAEIDPAVRAVRKLPNGAASFRYNGAVHSVDVDVSVTF